MEKVTVRTLKKKKIEKTPIVALTCYDWASAKLVDASGVDIALVGDSLANARLGYPHTLPVTMDEMLHHTKAVSRGIRNALLITDMPFQSYEVAPWKAVEAAGRFLKEGGAEAVKVEGGHRIADSIKAMINANIPVMGHIGLTPQSVHQQGGYRVQGKSSAAAKELLRDCKILEKLGVFAIVLEGIPSNLGRTLTKALKIPTIGIGAGPHCDGQILVLDDVVGFTEGPSPKFVKAFAHVRPLMEKALKDFGRDVRSKRFPSEENSYQG